MTPVTYTRMLRTVAFAVVRELTTTSKQHIDEKIEMRDICMVLTDLLASFVSNDCCCKTVADVESVSAEWHGIFHDRLCQLLQSKFDSPAR